MPPDEKPYKYENVPIPTYDEAISSQSRTPQSRTNEHGAAEEHAGLLGSGDARLPVPTRRQGYQPPTIEDARDSLDSLDQLGAEDFGPGRRRSSGEGDDDEEAVRREILEMDIEDPPSQSKWGQRISGIRSRFRIPERFKIKWPDSWPRIRWKIPRIHLDANFWILIARLIAVTVVVGMAYLLFVSDIFSSMSAKMAATMYEPERVRSWWMEQVNGDLIRDNLRHITSFDHVAGTEGDYTLGTWVMGQFQEAGLEDVSREQFDVYLNYPKAGGRAVEILKADGSVQWSANLEEEQVYRKPERKQAKAFHGHSKSGDVKGPLIYANYGSREDFKRLKGMGIDTKGAIALVRYFGTQGDRALKVKAAELAGFAGCLIYTDPVDDGSAGKGHGWPDGRYMPVDGVQRGAVSLMSWVVGDVLTPGWASTPGLPRLSPSDSPGLVQIPSLPLSWRDASNLILAIKDHGSPAPDDWQGAHGDRMERWTGDKSSPVVRLKNEQDENERQPIWNIHGKITGIESSEKSIIIGNHRDAWAFGAADPGSGTAVLLEIVRIFGDLKRYGWRPLRTIEFVSWDGEEYNLIGSTEYVEKEIERLREHGYAYLNVDTAVSGTDFFADASPVWHDTLIRVLDRVHDPSKNDSSLLDLWNKNRSRIGSLGAGSDYVAFQDIAGVSSIDFGFRNKEPDFPYHSVYDNFEWMDAQGDPGFLYHTLMGQIWGLLTLEMSDKPILPFSLAYYAENIQAQVEELDKWAISKGANGGGKEGQKVDLTPLRAAAQFAVQRAKDFELWGRRWEAAHFDIGNYESTVMMNGRLVHNQRASNFEKLLLDLSKDGGVSSSWADRGPRCVHARAITDYCLASWKTAIQTRPLRAAEVVRI